VNILAFDTSSSACSVALYVEDANGEAKILARHEHAPMQHTSIILPMMQALLDSARLKLAALDAIAFGCGPGSFTGIRIAASLAQGLAYANALPVIPVSSLAAAAQAAYMAHGWKSLLVAVDARMEQLYLGAYRIENNIVLPVFPDAIITPAAIPVIPQGDWYGIGDGWNIYGEQLREHLGRSPQQIERDIVPTAEAVLCLAKERYQKGDWVEASEALPVYLR
jgi:tRNA threonylcarbamoyladenosine biosynthesis protein TsaB